MSTKNYVVEELCPHRASDCVALSNTRYKGRTPAAAAKKVANRAAREHGLGIYYVTIRETSRANRYAENDLLRYKVRVLRATRQMKDEMEQSSLPFSPQRYARIEKIYT